MPQINRKHVQTEARQSPLRIQGGPRRIDGSRRARFEYAACEQWVKFDQHNPADTLRRSQPQVRYKTDTRSRPAHWITSLI